MFALLAACGGGGHMAPADAVADAIDAPPGQCQPIGATGQFYRRGGNPYLIAGRTFQDGRFETLISDPDLQWDEAAGAWQLYYHGPRGTSYASPDEEAITHATSPDLATWTVQDAPALAASTDPSAWDHVHAETPSVAIDPDAAPDHRYLMLYSGAAQALPNGLTAYAIGAAFSADGVTFTRVPAADSPHGQDGLVLTGADVYGNAVAGALVADPEVAYVAGTYHVWFSSYACTGAGCATATAYGVAHATSPDGVHWTVAEAPVRSLLRTRTMPTSGGAQPSVIYDAAHCRWEMWLRSDLAGDTDAQPVVFNNMAGVWHATSMDGATWQINYTGVRDLAWMPAAAGEHLGLLTGADVAAKGTARYMAYVGFDDQNVPSGFVLPDRSTQGYEPGVTTLELAARDAPP